LVIRGNPKVLVLLARPSAAGAGFPRKPFRGRVSMRELVRARGACSVVSIVNELLFRGDEFFHKPIGRKERPRSSDPQVVRSSSFLLSTVG